MASITKETPLSVSADRAWALLRSVGEAHRAFPGVLTGCRQEGDARIVTFAGGLVVRERIVDIDETRRRIAYAVVEGRFAHHSASMQVVPEGDEGCRFIWVTDFLPDDLAPMIRPLIDRGAEAFRHAAEERGAGE